MGDLLLRDAVPDGDSCCYEDRPEVEGCLQQCPDLDGDMCGRFHAFIVGGDVPEARGFRPCPACVSARADAATLTADLAAARDELATARHEWTEREAFLRLAGETRTAERDRVRGILDTTQDALVATAEERDRLQAEVATLSERLATPRPSGGGNGSGRAGGRR